MNGHRINHRETYLGAQSRRAIVQESKEADTTHVFGAKGRSGQVYPVKLFFLESHLVSAP
jgi:hypothetical protein